MNKVVSFLFIAFLLISCSEYQKALKSDDVAIKNEAANKMYEAGKYVKAIRLYEQIAPAYKGKPNAERMFYFYSMSLYKSKQYYLAGYQLENFVASYPKSEKREEAAFYAAECFYKLSPVYSLDQTDTEKALDKMQRFIDIYPESQFLPQANVYVKKLKEKYKLYILSNFHKDSFETISSRYNFFNYFDGGIVSAYHNCIKPDEKIYKLLIDKYNLNPTETLFIDDLEKNILKAQELGIKTIHLIDYTK